MPTYRVRDSVSGVTLDLTGDSPPTEQELTDLFVQYGKKEPERTVLGQIGETFKAVPRGVANTVLSTGEGLAELADAATNLVGAEGLIDTGDENALVKASKEGRDWIANSALGADPSYQDAWFTKFGEGAGSMLTFLAPVGILRGLGVAGKAIPKLGTTARELAVTGALATGAGAGDQAQRVAAARAQGLEVTQGEEDAAVGLGGLIGLSEIAPIASILKRVPKNITPAQKSRILDLLQKSIRGGAEEAVQEGLSGLAQDLVEQQVYNENLPVGQSFWDDLTVGGAVGAFADFVVNAAAGRRSFMTTQAQREYEAQAREREQANIEKIRQSLATAAERRANIQADPEGFTKAAAQAQAAAAGIAAPTGEGPPVQRGGAYARAISRELGDYFPTNTKFEIKPGPPKQSPEGQTLTTHIVVDSTGKQYGQVLDSYEEAAALAYGLNTEAIDQQVRGQVLNTLETAGQSYDQVTADTLTRYGVQILNPDRNKITSAAINEAAGTTADKGYIENYSFQTILDGQKDQDGYVVQGPNQQPVKVPGLTAAQQINQKRKEKGLPETQVFTVEEAREALGDKFERLTDINVAAIPDNLTYTATIIDKKPVVVSAANEVFESRFASQEDSDAAGKNEDGTPKVKVGQKIELKSLEDAQAFAERKNKEAARGQGLSTAEINALLKGKKTLNDEINNLLTAKNISSGLDSPEIKTLFKSIVGKESLSDMNFGEQRLLYARLRTLPMFEATTKLPVFEAKPYTRDNFLAASKFVQDANSLGQAITDDQIAQAAGLLPNDERKDVKVQAIKADLVKQGVPVTRAAKPVLALPAPTGTTDTYNFLREEIRKKMKGFGLDDIATRIDQTLLNFGDPVRYMQEMGAETEGYYNPFLREITLAVDRIDPQKTLTPEQRVNALVDVLNHEIVHPVRELDLWTAKEWDTLSNASARLKRKDDQGKDTGQTYLEWARQNYADQSPLVQEEESVADLSRQAKKFGAKAVAGKPKVLADRLFNFFDRLDNSFRGAGFQSYSDILDRLQSGEVGARTRGEIRTLRATEAEMAQQGILPERFGDYQPILATPVVRNQEREKKKVEVQQKAQASGVTDFNPAALEGAAIRESRRAIENIPKTIDVDGAVKPTDDSEGRAIYSGYEGPEVYGIQTAPTQTGLRNFWNWFSNSKAVDSQGRPVVYYHGTAADITEFRPKQAGSVFITRNPEFSELFAGYSNNYMIVNFPDFMNDQEVSNVLTESMRSATTPKFYDKLEKIQKRVANRVGQGKALDAKSIADIKELYSDKTGGLSSKMVDSIRRRLPSAPNLMPVYVKAENPWDYENKDHVRALLKEVKKQYGAELDVSQLDIENIRDGDWVTIEGSPGNSPFLDAIRNLGFDSMYVKEAGTKNLAVFNPEQIKSAIGNNGQFGPTPSIMESRKDLSETPIVNALRIARRGFNDYSSSSQEEFFGNFWPKIIGRTQGTVVPAPENVRTAVDRAVNDLQGWLSRNPRYVDYYNKDFAATKQILETRYGPLDEDQFTMFRLIAGLTSPSTELNDNIGDAVLTFDVWNRDGNFDSFVMGRSPKGNVVLISAPHTLIGPTLSNKARTLKVIERLTNEKGGAVNALNYLREQIPVKDLHNFNREMGYAGKVGDVGPIKGLVRMATGQDQLIPRMFIFGPKVGAYTLNMTGDSRYNTVDIWESRFIRSYFTGMFAERYGLPENVSEHELFQDFVNTFKEVFEAQTGRQWENSALQAIRWFYILDAARRAGYTEARTNETISEYTRRNIQFPRPSRPYRRGQGDGDISGEVPPSIRESRMGPERAGDRRGRYQGRVFAPLEGAPNVQGAGPIPEIVVAAEQYAQQKGIPYQRQSSYVEVDEVLAKRIADAFQAMRHDPKNPAVAEAYNDLIKQTRDQYDALIDAGYTFTFFDSATDPYGGNPFNAMRDLRNNKQMAVYGTYDGYGTEGITDSELANNPMLQDTGLRWPDQNGIERMVNANDLFRAVHDAFGHGIEGAGFRARGEENAWQAHARLFTGPALAALTTETRGQNSWLNYGPYGERNRTAKLEDTVFAEQKTGLMPEWTWQEGIEKEPEVTPQVSAVAPRPEVQLQDAAKKAQANIDRTPTGAIPLYNLNASPDALYVAQNPEAGEKFDAQDLIRYSRQNQPQYTTGVQQIIDKLAVDPPNQTPGQTVVTAVQLPPIRNIIDKLRQQFIFNYSRLEYYNQRHPSLINNMADVSSLAGAEMADRHKAITASAITDGVPVYRNGLVRVERFVHNNREYKGLIDVMAPLYNNPYGNLERLAQAYAIAKRGRRLTAEGKLAPGDPADLPQLLAEVRRFTNPATGNSIIEEWYDAWQAYNAYTVQFLRDTGMIDDAGAQLWLQQSDYIPFYRETAAGTVAHPKIFGGLTSTSHMKAVGKSSEAINLPLLDSVLTNLDAAIGMGMRNVAQQRIVRDMIQIGMGRMVQPGQLVEGQPTVTFKVAGKKYTAFIDDPLIFESMQAMPDMGAAGILENVFRVPATVLRELIVREPGYMIANMLRDTASVALTSGANIIPVVDTVRNFNSGLENLRRYGVVGGYDFARDPEQMSEYLADEARKRGHQIPVDYDSKLKGFSKSKYMRPLMAAWDALGGISDKSEASTRNAVYQDTLKRTGNEAEAVYQALSVINYGRRGRNPSIRAITASVPFLNARIQGLDKLYQAGTGQAGAFKDRRKNFAQFVFRAGLMVGLTGLYYALVSDDDEYKNANPEVVDNYYILPVKDADPAKGEKGLAIRIPIPFEVGLLFKTLPERIMRRYYDVDVARDTAQSLKRAVTSTLAFNPVPQAVLPIAEVIANYDTFTGRAIIPPYMDERMAAEYQAKFGTNELARILGEATGISPIKIDHLMNGYLGTLGTYTLDAIDHVARDADRMYPSREPYEYPFVRRFFTDSTQPGLQTQYYDLYKEVGKVTNTIRQLREDGRVDELNAYLMENQSILGIKSGVDVLNKRMKQYRDQKEAILKSTLDPEQKKELIDDLDASINQTLQVVPILKRAAYNEQRQAG
jgi:Large polyvalent protein associated domain 38/ADP-Ribosyltransferase in polyvalent proteins